MAEVLELFLADKKRAYEKDKEITEGRFQELTNVLTNRLLPFCDGHSLNQIPDGHFENYPDWRRANFVRTRPQNSTIRAEVGDFKTFFRWAKRRRYLKGDVPDFPSVPVRDLT